MNAVLGILIYLALVILMFVAVVGYYLCRAIKNFGLAKGTKRILYVLRADLFQYFWPNLLTALLMPLRILTVPLSWVTHALFVFASGLDWGLSDVYEVYTWLRRKSRGKE